MAHETQPRPAPRLIDVARRAGVSIATASRSLAGRSGVSDSVAAHVQQVAFEMGYVADAAARSLAGGTSAVAGLIVYEIGDPYFSEIATGVVRRAAETGWMVQISHATRDPGSELDQIRLLRSHRVGAIIVAGSGHTDPEMEQAANREILDYVDAGGRVAVIGRHHLPCDAVLPDNEPAGRVAAEHLLSLGHRSVAVVTGPRHLTTLADRLSGVTSALADAGIEPASVPIVEEDFTREGGHRAMARLQTEHPEVTAVVALNDTMAIGVISLLRERGVAIPGEISVIGCDDLQVAADIAPALTTVRLPMVDMGTWAFEMVLGPRPERPRRRSTGHELVVRASTGPAPGRDEPRKGTTLRTAATRVQDRERAIPGG